MKDDRQKYMPDVEKVLREHDPATFDERQRKALTRAYQAGLIDRLTPQPDGRVSAPSPWATAGAEAAAGEIDKAALPSAMAPDATAPVEERPVTKRVGPVEAMKRRWPQSWKLVLGFALVGLSMAPLSWWAGRSKGVQPAAAGSTGAGVTTMSAATGAVPEDSAPLMEVAAPQVATPPSASASVAPPAPASTVADAGVASPRRPPVHPPASPRPIATDILP
jgi:hypothetical protein